jgi:phosphomannomutase
LQAAVVAHDADFGIIFDGDADALGVIDERGHRVAADHLLALLARDLLIRVPGAVVGSEFGASPVLVETVRAGRGMLLSASIGKDTWRGGSILLGGDRFGHLFMGENYYGFEDAPLAVLKILELFSKTDQSFSQLIDELSNDDAK